MFFFCMVFFKPSFIKMTTLYLLACAHSHTHQQATACVHRSGTTCRNQFLPSTTQESQASNSEHQVWRQVPLPTEPAHGPSFHNVLPSYTNYIFSRTPFSERPWLRGVHCTIPKTSVEQLGLHLARTHILLGVMGYRLRKHLPREVKRLVV